MRLTSISTLVMSILLAGSNAYAADTSTASSTTTSSTSSATLGAAPTSGGTELSYLQQIATSTYYTLAAINNVPTYLDTITKMALSWLTMESDSTSFIMQSQADFANLGTSYSQSANNQATTLVQSSANYLGQNASDFTNPANAPKILTTIPNINDMFYSSIVGMPPVAKGAFVPSNYLINSMGALIPHAIPDLSWKGSTITKSIYTGYYTTIISANSFGAYVLNGLIAEYQSGAQQSTLQNSLIARASQSSWLAQIATEELGKVMRDILLFQSQNYVLMSKLVDLQKQTLIAQVMTNSLLVATNQGAEPKLLTDALGVTK
jgi:hypothetical protein